MKAVYILFVFAIYQTLAYPGEGGPTYYVDPGCTSCGDATYPTIRAAYEALPDSGGVIVLYPGSYIGSGNTGIQINKPITLKSSEGGVVIDCQGGGYGFQIQGYEFQLENLAIVNCNADSGAALHVSNGIATTIYGVHFDANHASGNGGAIWQDGGVLTIGGSTFTGNTAADGSAIYIGNTAADLESCTFNGNQVNILGCSAGAYSIFLTTVDDQSYDSLATALCPRCTIIVEAINYCTNPPPPTAPVAPNPVAPTPVAPAPVTPTAPTAPVAPVAPTPVETPGIPVSAPFIFPFPPNFDGPTFGEPGSASSTLVNVVVVIGSVALFSLFQ